MLRLSHIFEGWAKEIARASEKVWQSSSRTTKPLAFLIATLAERIKVPETLGSRNSKDGLEIFTDATVKLFQKYYKQIKENNGIKEKNVLALFGPLGVLESAFGATLLPNLDALGSIRGTHAHQSAQAVQSVLDPETEYNRVETILTDLASLDQWLVTYKRSIR